MSPSIIFVPSDLKIYRQKHICTVSWVSSCLNPMKLLLEWRAQHKDFVRNVHNDSFMIRPLPSNINNKL